MIPKNRMVVQKKAEDLHEKDSKFTFYAVFTLSAT